MVRHVSRSDCEGADIRSAEIRRFHKVDDDLYRGASPTCAGYQKLAELGVRTIIDLQGHAGSRLRNCSLANADQFQYVPFNLNLMETGLAGVPHDKLMKLFALIDQVPKPIFLSCKFGEDRSGVVVALYRVKRHELSYDAAVREALYYGYEPLLLGLRRTLARYRDPREIAALPAPHLASSPASGACLVAP